MKHPADTTRLDEMSVLALVDARLELPDLLSDAEAEVARLVYHGQSNAEIAQSRGTATRTVANQIASIFTKLGIGSRAELIRLLSGMSP
jgi:DNA-binding CsgD family transcriptional regulator